MRIASPSLSRALRLALLATLTLPMAACFRPDPSETASMWRDDYRDRHPILIAQGEQTLDVFYGVNGGRLDRRQYEDVEAFGRDYATHGRGVMTAFVPAGGRGHGAGPWLDAIRQTLVRSGVNAGALVVRSYRVPDDGMTHPVRLVYSRIQAGVATRCGQFPADVADFGTGLNGAKNRDYYDLGCSYQHNLAQQVAEPLDLVRGRPETRPDTQRRIEVFEKARKGEDPSTNWRQKATTINTTVGAN